MARFEFPAEMSWIDAGFLCSVVIEGHLEELKVFRAHIGYVLFGSEDPADSAAVPVEALDEELFQHARPEVLGELGADGNQLHAVGTLHCQDEVSSDDGRRCGARIPRVFDAKLACDQLRLFPGQEGELFPNVENGGTVFGEQMYLELLPRQVVVRTSGGPALDGIRCSDRRNVADVDKGLIRGSLSLAVAGLYPASDDFKRGAARFGSGHGW